MSVNSKVILIDPGHGGDFPGATYNHWRWGYIEEKDVALNVGLKLRDKLQSEGATVRMTRVLDTDFGGVDEDDDINKRVEFINEMRGSYDALVSLHVNSPTGLIGPYYMDDHYDSSILAQNIAHYLGTTTHTSNLAILRDTNYDVPKVLVEMERISSGSIHHEWWEDEVVDQMVDGLNHYF